MKFKFPVSRWLPFGLTAALFAASTEPAAPARVKIEPAGRIDLGEVGPLEPVEQRYRFTNLGSNPIAMRVYDLSPGVTVAGPALDRPIPGGATAGLVLRVDPTDWVGAQKRNVRLGTDDPGQGDYYLPVSLAVRPDLTVDRLRRSFGDLAADSRPQVEFCFARETLKPLWLRVANPLPEYLECEVRPAGSSCRLVCRFRPDRVEPGMRLGLERIRVESNAPLQPRFDLYLDWRLHHPVEAAPPRLVFLDPRPDTLQLRLRALDGTPFRILSAELEGGGFRLADPDPAAAAEQVLSVRRVSLAPARAVLVLRFSGVAGPLKVPVAYLPAQAPDLEGAKVEPDPNP